MKMELKKGSQQILGYLISLGVFGLVLMLYAIVGGAFKTSQATNSLPANIAGNVLDMWAGVTAQFVTIGTIGGVLILFTLVGFILFRGKGQGF